MKKIMITSIFILFSMIHNTKANTYEFHENLKTSLSELNNLDLTRNENHYLFGFNHQKLNYNPETLSKKATNFKSSDIGLFVGEKTSNQISNLNGYFEWNINWEKFERRDNKYFQNLDQFKFSVYQNFEFATLFKKALFLSTGIGLSPAVLFTNKSAFSEAETHYGALLMWKLNFNVPLKRLNSFLKTDIDNFFSLDLGLEKGLGLANNQNLNTTNFYSALNFWW
jgi:hypothetical protein